MRSALKLGLVFLSLLTALGGRAARAETDDDSSATVLVSPEQGEALAAFALQSERRIRSKARLLSPGASALCARRTYLSI